MATFEDYIKGYAINEAARLPKLKLFGPNHPIVAAVTKAIDGKLYIVSNWTDKRCIDSGRGVYVEWLGSDELPVKSDCNALAKSLKDAFPNYKSSTNVSSDNPYFGIEFTAKKSNENPQKFGIRFDFSCAEWSYNALWFSSYIQSSKEFAKKVADIVEAACGKCKIESFRLFHPMASKPPYSFGTKGKSIEVRFKKRDDADKFNKACLAGIKKAKLNVKELNGLYRAEGKDPSDYWDFRMSPRKHNYGWLAMYEM